jgi:predicted AAA+ superfamily ATPase
VSAYVRRVVDDQLDRLELQVSAVSLEGPKAVGKTTTARQRSATVYELDDPDLLSIARANPRRLTDGVEPILIDEWQKLPESWDRVRRSVDHDHRPGRFILTGSTTLELPSTHSGAGRIVSVRMRPLSLFERGVGVASVSFAELLSGSSPDLGGATSVRLEDYVREIVVGGFPSMRSSDPRDAQVNLDGYIERVVDRDFVEAGQRVRRRDSLLRWLAAYAAASSTTASFETIRDAASGGHGDKPSRSSTVPYRDILQRLWLIDEVPAWLPSDNHLRRLGATPKHQLADPALAARLLGVDAEGLLSDRRAGPRIAREGPLLGALFESLATLGVRVFAQGCGAQVRHLRTGSGDHEVDLIVARPDQRVLAIEVKLTQSVDRDDVKHLNWLNRVAGDDVVDRIVITTGTEAYRRPDGVGVVPLALLGP